MPISKNLSYRIAQAERILGKMPEYIDRGKDKNIQFRRGLRGDKVSRIYNKLLFERQKLARGEHNTEYLSDAERVELQPLRIRHGELQYA